MKAPRWTLCSYTMFWYRVRPNAKRCPKCGATLEPGTHPIRRFRQNPNPPVDPKGADSHLAN